MTGCRDQRAGAEDAEDAAISASDVVVEECPPSPLAKEGERSIVQHIERTIVYEALLTQGQSLEKVQAMQRHIERLGGSIRIEQAGRAVLVTLTLPAPYTADLFFPSAPFFPV